MPVLYFSLLLIAYYALHSILAADGVKAKLYRLVPARYYRLGYNLLATVLLAAIFYRYFTIEKRRYGRPTRYSPTLAYSWPWLEFHG
ncbi:MAG: hypothetical protein IPM82_28230 [Saprospiraceae bacterium]|nr:hypothetical protein [Saprospiraceae bacterium]